MNNCEHRAKQALKNVVVKYDFYLREVEAAKQNKNVLRQHTMEDAAHTHRMLAENLYYVLTGEVTDKIEVLKEYVGA